MYGEFNKNQAEGAFKIIKTMIFGKLENYARLVYDGLEGFKKYLDKGKKSIDKLQSYKDNFLPLSILSINQEMKEGGKIIGELGLKFPIEGTGGFNELVDRILDTIHMQKDEFDSILSLTGNELNEYVEKNFKEELGLDAIFTDDNIVCSMKIPIKELEEGKYYVDIEEIKDNPFVKTQGRLMTNKLALEPKFDLDQRLDELRQQKKELEDWQRQQEEMERRQQRELDQLKKTSQQAKEELEKLSRLFIQLSEKNQATDELTIKVVEIMGKIENAEISQSLTAEIEQIIGEMENLLQQ